MGEHLALRIHRPQHGSGSQPTGLHNEVRGRNGNLFAASNNGDNGARAIGTSGNFFDPLPFSPAMQQQDWFTSLANPAWKSSLVGTYKSEPNAALNGLYTTAGFGVTNFRTGAPGLPGLTNFSSGNDAVGVSASAGVGFQVTPQISIEGSVSFTQMPPSTVAIIAGQSGCFGSVRYIR